MGAGRGAPGRRDLVPVVEVLAPEARSPEPVEPVDDAVAAHEPLAEGLLAVIAVAPAGGFASQAGVDLPGVHLGPSGEGPGDFAQDAAHVAAVGPVVQADVPAAAARPLFALPVLRQDAGVTGEQPRRRCGRRRAQDDVQPLGRERLDGPVQPPGVELAAPLLQAPPGELAQAHGLDARLPHQAGVLRPPLLGPVFRVVGYPDLHLRLRRGAGRMADESTGQAPTGHVAGRTRTARPPQHYAGWGVGKSSHLARPRPVMGAVGPAQAAGRGPLRRPPDWHILDL